jgi:hypothetical protein
MGNSQVVPATQLVYPPATPGKQRVCVSGFTLSTHAGRAQQVAALIAATYADSFESWFRFSSNDEFRGPNGLLTLMKAQMPEGHPLKAHTTSPFVWIESTEQVEGSYKPEGRDVFILPLGGRDRFVEWVHKQPVFASDAALLALATTPSLTDAWVNEEPGTSQAKK